MADDVKVKLGADYADLDSGMEEAASVSKASLDSIAQSLKQLVENSNETSNEIKEGTDKIAEGFGELKGHVGEVIEDLKGRFEVLRTAVAAVIGSISGGAIFGEIVSSALEAENAVRQLTISFGITSEQAVLLRTNLQLAGVSADEFSRTAINLGRKLMTDGGEAFDRLGVAVKDAQGNLLPMQDVMQNTYKAILQFKPGIDQEMASLELAGRSAKSYIADMELLNATNTRAEQLVEELGIEMGDAQQDKIRRYRIEVNAFKITMDKVSDTIGMLVIPHLEVLAKWWASFATEYTPVLVNAIKAVISSFDALRMILREIGNVIGAAAGVFVGFGKLLKETFDLITFRGSFGRVQAAYDALVDIVKDSAKRMLDIWTDYNFRVNTLWNNVPGPPPERAPTIPKGGKKSWHGKPKAGAAEDTGWMENELKAEQDAYNKRMLQQGSFEVWSEQQTRDYWEEILSMTTLSAKERQEAENHYYDAERKVQTEAFQATITGLEAQKASWKYNSDERIKIAQQEAALIAQRFGEGSKEAIAAYAKITEEFQRQSEQRQRIADIERQQMQAAYKNEIAMYRIAADQEVALKRMSSQQRYELEAQYLEQEHAAEMAEIEREIAEAKAARDVDEVGLAKLLADKMALEERYQQQLTTLTNKAVQDRLKDELAAYDQIQSAVTGLFTSMQNNVRNWKQNFKDAINSITQALNQMAAKKIMEAIIGPGTEGGSLIQKLLGTVTGTGGPAGAQASAAQAVALADQQQAIASKAVTDIATLMQTTFANLNIAADKAASALASVGGGGSGGGGLFGDLFGGGGGLDLSPMELMPMLASGTPYVPQDMVAMLHKGEAVIPASMNKSAYGGGAAPSINAPMTFVLNGPADTRTQDQVAAAAFRGIYRAHRRIL